jgi:hypothetical protein
MRKLIRRLRGVPLFPVIPILPIAIVVSDAVFAVLNFRRLKRLEGRIVRPIHSERVAARARA